MHTIVLLLDQSHPLCKIVASAKLTTNHFSAAIYTLNNSNIFIALPASKYQHLDRIAINSIANRHKIYQPFESPLIYDKFNFELPKIQNHFRVNFGLLDRSVN